MEANELRIGNFVMVHNFAIHEGGKPVEWAIGQVSAEGIAQADKFKPIPLSEEWLLKFGLEQMKDSTTYEWKDGDYRSVQVDLKAKEAEIYLCGADSVMSSDCFPIDHIKYVHEFQNLFFALKAKELTLK
ncbi:hypothetical protein [Chryseobacterium indologenes]|uniref:hypothetical protein n=1 Tax=Chryseobacterium indologenes TaxID=253 RepID=UPI003D358A2A